MRLEKDMEVKSELTNRSKMIFNENNELKNQMEKMNIMKNGAARSEAKHLRQK